MNNMKTASPKLITKKDELDMVSRLRSCRRPISQSSLDAPMLPELKITDRQSTYPVGWGPFCFGNAHPQ
jgi:hypothetical protein